MSAHPSQSPARNEDAPTRIVAAQHDPSANLLALADAIEACLHVSVGTDNVAGDERTLALDPHSVIVRPQQPQRVLTTQPLAVQSKPTAIFASRLPAHFVAPSPVVITAPPATTAAIAPPEKTAVEAPRKQTLFVQPAKRRSKAPWLAVAALLIAAVGVGGYVERGHIQQYRAQMAAKPAPATPVAQIAQPQAAPVVAQPAPVVAQPVAAQPVAEPVVVVVAQPVAPVAQPEAQPVTARVKHRETHARKPDAKPASDTAQASNDTKPEPRGEAKPESKPDMKAATDAMLKAQLDSAL